MDIISREMPKYRCHKEVWALKIEKVEPSCGNRPAGPNECTDGGFIITPADDGYAPFKVDREYGLKHRPEAGGYYVVYKDGYKSFSPAEAFEDGYSAI
jgi:hypothetical protein